MHPDSNNNNRTQILPSNKLCDQMSYSEYCEARHARLQELFDELFALTPEEYERKRHIYFNYRRDPRRESKTVTQSGYTYTGGYTYGYSSHRMSYTLNPENIVIAGTTSSGPTMSTNCQRRIYQAPGVEYGIKLF